MRSRQSVFQTIRLPVRPLKKETRTGSSARLKQASLPRVVRLDGASHNVFESNEADVLREMNDFIRSLPKPGASLQP